jgi:hypothetical protein
MENTNNKLVAYYQKELVRKSLIPSIIMTTLCTVLFFIIPLHSQYFIIYLVKLVAKAGVGFMAFSGATGLLFYYFMLKDNAPYLVMDERGMTLKYYGFIPWENIQSINFTPKGFLAGQLIDVWFKDNKLVYKQASWQGKMNLLWARIFKYAPARIAGLSVPTTEIVAFAHQYLTKKTDQ